MDRASTKLDLDQSFGAVAAYFSRTPLAHAVFRGTEAFSVGGEGLDDPILDLGCGTGEFASLALAASVDVGVDIEGRQLAKAAVTQKYGRLLQADARDVPLADETFGTVLSVSALEHIAEPDAVLGEVYRLLRPGGKFIGTVVLPDLHEHLFYPRLLRRVGLGLVGRWYVRMQDRCFKHRTLLSKEAWESLLREQRFQLVTSKRILSPRLTRCWDMLLPLALPGWLLGRHLVWRPRWLARRLARWLEPRARADEERGSILFVVAQKPEADSAEVERVAATKWEDPECAV